MLRISCERQPGDTHPTLLRLDGEIAGPWAVELRRVAIEVIGGNGSSGSGLVLDLAGVSFLSADGLALFRELATRGVQFFNCSMFVAEQLKGVANVNR
jgi:anti-anti-sigma regulatory factor